MTGRGMLLTAEERIGRQIGLFHILGNLFLVLAVLFLILSVTLFFVLDIRTMIREKTGRKRRPEETGEAGWQSAVDELFDAAGAPADPLQEGLQSLREPYGDRTEILPGGRGRRGHLGGG